MTHEKLPPEAYVGLAQLSPAIEPPQDAPGADALPEKVAGIVAQAEAALAKSQYARAAFQFERARGFVPDSPRVLRGLGLAYAQLGDQVKATAALTASAKAAPDHVRVQLLLGTYASLRRQSPEAIAYFRRALACGDAADDNPDTAEALLRLAVQLEHQKCLTAALDCYKRLSELVSSNARACATRPVLLTIATQPERIMVSRGRLLLRLDRPAEAAVMLEEAYRRDKTHPEAGPLAARALRLSGAADRAGTIVLEMLADQHPRAIASAEEFVRAGKDPKAPRKLLEAYIAAGGRNPSMAIAMAEALADMGKPGEAVDVLRKHLAESPQDSAVALRLVRLYGRTGDRLSAGRQLATMLAGEGAWLGQVEPELRRLAAQKQVADLVRELTVAAETSKGRQKPALLTVAGVLAWSADDGASAKEALNKAVAADERFWPAYEALEQIYGFQGDAAAADKLAADVKGRDGDGFFGYYLLARNQYTRGNLAGAIGNLEQARARNSRYVPAYLLLGQACFQSGRFDDAEKAMLTAVAMAGADAGVNRRLFDFYVAVRKLPQARQVARRFLKMYPDSVSGRIMSGRYYLAVNDFNRAREQLAELLAEAPDDVDVRLLQLQLELPSDDTPVSSDKIKRAMDVVGRILRLDRRNLEARARYAALLARQGKHAESAAQWEIVYRRMPSDPRVASAYLDALVKSRSGDQAVAALENVADREGAAPAVRQLAIEQLVRMKRYASAEKLVEKWMRQARTGDARQELELLRYRALTVYEQAGSFDKAQKLLDEWIGSAESEPGLAAALKLQKLEIYDKARRYDPAIEYVVTLAPDDPHRPSLRDGLMRLLLEAKQYDKAQEVLDGWMLETGPPERKAVLKQYQMRLLAERGQFDKLLTLARQWRKDAPHEDAPYRATVGVLVESKKYDAALAWAQDWLAAREKITATSTAPAGEANRELLAIKGIIVEILVESGRANEALAKAQVWARREPKELMALGILVAAYRALDRQDDVMNVLEKMLALDPNDPGVNNDLGYIYADRGVNMEQAETMIRKALASRSDSLAVIDSFGWLLYKQGRLAEAKTVFDRIVPEARRQEQAVILDHAGDVLWRVGLTGQAVELWEQAAAVNKKTPPKDAESKRAAAQTAKKLESAHKGRVTDIAPLGKGAVLPEE